LTHVCSFSLIL